VDKQSNIKDVDSIKEKSLALEAFQLIRYYELRGHELAAIDPLCTRSLIQHCKTTVSLAKYIVTK
jgi:2-oxoglutarate dehydrogenase complex dehydrogenase (E1) component-like enzyme